ncbi:IS1380 family transposase [Pseudofrankia sp. BMG5.36]|uniref:IS1380 family transposase n=1 Tax=Pseudofrankia sp. BMG5.36 TaxID=1834512 RepID=UPI000E2A3BC9|nr:IS1380 family transposase [Pseudofrankia sp. BMG5.36]
MHTASRTHVAFDDPSLLGSAGLVPVMRLAERAGLGDLVAEHVKVPASAWSAGANAAAKVGCLVAGMAAGADCLDDMNLLRAGALDGVFDGIRAPSTLGMFARAFTWGNVAQLGKVNKLLLVSLAAAAPALLTGADALTFVDLDTCQRRVFGPRKRGARFGHTKIASKSVFVRGLNAMIGTVSTPTAAPVIANARLRGGNAVSAKGAARFLAATVGTARQAGATGVIVARCDAGFYTAEIVAAARRQQVHFSITTPQNVAIRAACEAIDEAAWVPIRYPNAIWDEDLKEWISDAEIAETTYTAFGHTKTPVTARLIVRRVKALNRKANTGQGELFDVWRYHAAFTDSPFALPETEGQHRDHAIIEQVNADLIHGPLAHLPSEVFTANAAWLVLAAITHNLLRAAGTLASRFHGRARGATLRAHLVNIPGRLARHGRGHVTVHLPTGWHAENAFTGLVAAVHALPPARAA